MGKSTSPSKHQCLLTLPCTVLLSEVGKRYHAFPKGTFRTRFAPPAVPCSMLSHIKAHPLTWTWTMKAGPKAGKSFTVPTVPTSCRKDSPKAIMWIVSIFHAFKSQLTPCALDPATGWVLPTYVKVYQNNMLIHLRGQQAHPVAKPSSPPSHPRAQPGIPSHPTGNRPLAEIEALRAEIMALHAKFQAFKTSFKSDLSSSPSPPPSPCTAPTVVPPNPPSPSTTSTSSMVEEGKAHSNHPWLQEIIDSPRCPPLFKHINSSMVPNYSHALPDDVQLSIVVMFGSGLPPWHLGFNSNSNLCVANIGLADSIIIMFLIHGDLSIYPCIPSPIG
ncbi:hypothetical protein SCLCIDRAFT_23316 [Scleroderma citrinum Foug A]|uniref:Uncharacterized protein n=1 Tax=Scleroderma citrinum Foug A TaxID=1036808 RepID=A0A0C3E867_9AGAM|nr:hypothetical protein SCLCIDRAFT_23316 [Scleroderma citrinum Foug A]